LKTRLLHYRHRANHRVSPAVYAKLQLTRALRAVGDWRTAPLPDGASFCFVVGCANSGTTLVAGKLGLHPDVLAISRESGIFVPTHGLRLARVIAQEWLAFARQEGRRVILEKTPKHVHAAARIRCLLPGARILVLARNPLDTVASLFRRYGDLEFAIERWIMDNAAALDLLQLDGTMLVRYEDLTREPAATLAAVCGFLDIPWDPDVLTRAGSVFGADPNLRPNMAVRHEQVSQPIRANSGKWREVLSAAQAEQVRGRTGTLAQRLGLAEGSA
jgi:hypothetical protein